MLTLTELEGRDAPAVFVAVVKYAPPDGGEVVRAFKVWSDTGDEIKVVCTPNGVRVNGELYSVRGLSVLGPDYGLVLGDGDPATAEAVKLAGDWRHHLVGVLP